MPSTKAKKEPKPIGPDDLVRETAGSYVSGDGRFEVRQSDTSWYLVDREQANEFGQELMHGPFRSMKAAKSALPGARDIKPLLRSTVRPKRAPDKKAPPKPRPTWIDRLPAGEAAEVRKLIRALEGEGITDAEAVVRRDRQGLLPAIASTLLAERLSAAIDELPEADHALARKLVAKLDEVISSGEQIPGGLPGWALFELGPGREPTKRRLRLS